MAQEKSIKAQTPQDAEKDTLAAKKVARLIGNLADERCQTAATPWVPRIARHAVWHLQPV
jgi:hypothetical protein